MLFNDAESHENIEWLAANLIYSPSYVSLHTALSWYNLIPEMDSHNHLCFNPEDQQILHSPGDFRLSPDQAGTVWFWIYTGKYGCLQEWREKRRKIMVATPQKAILDFFYINSFYDSEKDMEDLRLNDTELAKIINEEFYRYLERYQSKALDRRIRIMTKIYGL